MLQTIALVVLSACAVVIAAALMVRLFSKSGDAPAPAAGPSPADAPPSAPQPAPPPAPQPAEQREDQPGADAALLLREQWYRHLFNNTSDMILVHGITEDGRPGPFRDVNDLACAKLGYTRSKLLTLTPADIEEGLRPPPTRGFTRVELATLPDEDILDRRGVLESRALMRRVLEETRATYDRVFLSRTGTRIPVQVDARRIDVLDEPMIMCVARDMSERNAAERALLESEQRSQDFFARSPIGVAIYDAARKLLNVNQACLKLFGCPGAAEFSRLDPFDNPFVPAPVKKRLLEGESVRYETTVDFEEARRASVLVTSRADHAAHFDIIVTNLGADSEFRPKGFLVQVQDITDRRRAEEALMNSERQLRQAQKMQAIGTLAGGIAHDFNNILTPILGYTEMTLYACTENEAVQKFLKEVMKAANRAKDLVTQILTFSRQMEPEAKPIRVSPIVKEVLALLRASLPRNVEVKRVIKTEHDIIEANPTQVHQILMNLCTNAGHAMREAGGTLEVWLTDFVIGPRSRGEFPHLDPGRYLRLTVKDTGVGMDEKTVERIFEPFFTTRERGEGTGMGLAVVHGIVTALKGAISVETAPGKGATFHVVLPLMDRPEAEQPQQPSALPSGTECVLFVDDDVDIGNMASRMLQTLGYQPVVSSRSEDALWLFRENPDQFAVVILDQVMPRMTGLELAGQMRGVRPGVPVILCTGYGDATLRQQAEEAGIREVVSKPVVMRHLAEAIRRVLDRKQPPPA
jgi:signal transduction histidine kinase/ActR/RegA family two-component response regulator